MPRPWWMLRKRPIRIQRDLFFSFRFLVIYLFSPHSDVYLGVVLIKTDESRTQSSINRTASISQSANEKRAGAGAYFPPLLIDLEDFPKFSTLRKRLRHNTKRMLPPFFFSFLILVIFSLDDAADVLLLHLFPCKDYYSIFFFNSLHSAHIAVLIELRQQHRFSISAFSFLFRPGWGGGGENQKRGDAFYLLFF